MIRKRLSELSFFEKLTAGIALLGVFATIIAAFIARPVAPNNTPALETQIFTPSLTATGETSTPSVTPTFTLIPTSSTEPPAFFTDNFDLPEINNGWWIIGNTGLSIKDNALYANYTNETNGFTGQYIEKRERNPAFNGVEFQASIEDGTSNGLLRLTTSCNSDTRLYISFYPELGTKGIYTANEQEIELAWGIVSAPDEKYVVRLIQDGDMVRAFVNGLEMDATYPCSSMGQWLWLAANAGPAGHIEGYIDYIKLYTE